MTDPARPIYLDHNASTPVLPEVAEAMLPYLGEYFGNPSSPHFYGRAMHKAVEQARKQVAGLIDCTPGEIFFTSGGTEANNLAIRGVATANSGRKHIVTSVIEHPATAGPCTHLEAGGYRIDRIPVDQYGCVQIPDVREATSRQTLLISIMHANSETGTLQPIRQISAIGHASGALVHTDAAQSIGKVEVSVQHEEVDLLSIAGHKLYAPQGVGALYVRSGTAIEPLLIGAGHEQGLRPGTENVASIVGLGKACAVARRDLAEESRRVCRLRDRLWCRLKNRVSGLALNGHPQNRLPNTLNVRFPGIEGNTLLTACTAIAASTGSACHEAGASASSVILAMGVLENEAIGSVRLTLGRGSTLGDIDCAADELINAWQNYYPGESRKP